MSRTPALLLLAACSLRPYDWQADASATSTGAASTTTTGAITTSTTTTAPTSTGAVADTSTTSSSTGGSSGFNFVVENDVGGAKQCDEFAQDCPEGQKCVPASLDGDNAWESLICVPIVPNPAGLYEPCTVEGSPVSGKDTCDKWLVCWDVDPETGEGTCFGQCMGSPEAPTCADPNAECLFGRIALFCLPGCNPLLQTCGNNDICIPNPQDPNSFICVIDASGEAGQIFDPCEYVNACDPGLICANTELASECAGNGSAGCCLPFCDTSVVPAQCPGNGQECLPYYEDPGQAPAGLENVGVCGLPL